MSDQTSTTRAQQDPSTAYIPRGFTVRELARRWRVSPDKIRAMIKSGQLGAINTSMSQSGKPRFVILPQHMEAFERAHQVSPPPKPTPRRKRPQGQHDYYPD